MAKSKELIRTTEYLSCYIREV